MNIFKQLTDKSWATQGVIGAINDRRLGPAPAAKTGLAFFLAVLSSLFGLFIIGYRLRMAEPDWVPITEPGLLWFNTALLILGSVFMERSKHAANKGQIVGVRNNLTVAGLLTIGFLIGQYLAWGQLRAAGFYAVSDAAAAFFYLLTALHGLHLIGGLLVWARVTSRAWQQIEITRIKLSIQLCTTYWNYLLLVWFVIFTLLLST